MDDARPDVESFNPSSPFNYRGGWGYLLLTNFLPSLGNGTFTLRILAVDVEGRQTVLGDRVINAANSTSTVPFGAIDTPAQGGLVSGAAYNNFGWVLSRGPYYADPPHGGSVSVLIDSVVVGAPGGWTSRSDLTSLFPQATYPGITHAAGVFTFDSTAYSNGVHTIAWVAFNNNSPAQGAGIGSRYFTIQNGSSGPLRQAGADVISAPLLVEPPPNLGRTIGEFATIDSVSALRATLGYSLRRSSFLVDADATGTRTVRARTSDRVTIDASAAGVQRYEAYLVTGGRLRPLPVGASFDDRRGLLYWQPALGFTGAYDFIVLRDGRTAVPLRVTVSPDSARRSRTNRFMRGLFEPA